MNQESAIRIFNKEKLLVKVFPDRQALGTAAAAEVAIRMKSLLERQDRITMVFAAAPSQNEFLHALIQMDGIDWSRVTAFHMDEYIGLPEGAPQRFSAFLGRQLFDKVQPGERHIMDGGNATMNECERYGRMIAEAPIDIVCLGIGENGHLAFNDPPVADFQDPEIVKAVKLDEACRQQQVNDGCFPHIDDVPQYAITLTIPALMSGKHLYCIVPGATKRKAVERALTGHIATDCPATILRTHPDGTLYLDMESGTEAR